MHQNENPENIVIVGAGQAGAACAARLRKRGFEGRLILAGREPHQPYQRPPLSKKYLSGEWPLERLSLRPASFWVEQDVDLRTGCMVSGLDPVARTIRLGGEIIHWDKLMLATGTRPRMLQAVPSDMAGLHLMRSIDDVHGLRPEFLPGARLVVIGGGYVGLETAAVAVDAGLDVTVVEAAPRLLARVACKETASYFADLHRSHGVKIIEAGAVRSLLGKGRVTGVRLDDSDLAADIVLSGIGVFPETILAQEANIACNDGILVDDRGRTSANGIWAAGDCARFDLEGISLRLENVQNAIDQAENAADDMLGQGEPYAPVPWFWSDQYDVKLQIAGVGTGHDRIIPVIGETGLSHWYFRKDRLISVDAINDARAFMTAKRILTGRIPVDPKVLTEPGFEPKQLLK